MKAAILLLLCATALAQVSPAYGVRRDSATPTFGSSGSETKQGNSFRVLEFTHIASAAFDTATTIHDLHNGCLEDNPLMGRSPSSAHVIAFESAWTAGELLIAHVLRKKGHGRMAAIFLGESVIEHGVAGGMNTRQRCF